FTHCLHLMPHSPNPPLCPYTTLFRSHLPPGERIEGGEGLVHEQDVRLDRHGAGDGDPLLHAARELVRERVGELGETDLLDGRQRSEEHTSELQSLAYLVCRLLLEKKK